MAKANNSLLFGSAAFRYKSLRGFPQKASSRYLSINNESGKATLYRPALKALVAYNCDGRRVWDETLTEEEIYAEDGICAAVGFVATRLVVAEYQFSDTQTHVCCFDMGKKQFLFAGVTNDGGKTFIPYSLDYKEGRNGTVLWLALIPYINNCSNELKTVLENLASKPDDLNSNYKKLVKGEIQELPSSVLSQCYIFCDNIYYTVDREGFAGEIEVGIPKSGILPTLSGNLEIYSPETVASGQFTLPGLAANQKPPKKRETVSPDALLCRFALDENMTDAQKAKASKMYPEYIVPQWVLKAAHNIKFHHGRENIAQSLKQNNLFLFGPPGSGKTDGAMAIASALGLPFTHISISSNSDETVFTGNIIPEVDGLNGSVSSTVSYNSLEEMMEAAEMAPYIVYEELTGESFEAASIADCIRAYTDATRPKTSSGGIKYTFVESTFIHAIEKGWLVTIEEFTNARDTGIGIIINQLMDGYQQITLPTGKVIKRHPNSVIVFASNVDEAQCGEFEASTLSRLKPMYKVDMPSKGDMIKRVKSMTGFNDAEVLEKMADVVLALQKYVKEHALVGVCGVREFAGWVLQYQANCDFDPSFTQAQNLLSSAYETIVPSASPHEEDIEDITKDIIEPMLSF